MSPVISPADTSCPHASSPSHSPCTLEQQLVQEQTEQKHTRATTAVTTATTTVLCDSPMEISSSSSSSSSRDSSEMEKPPPPPPHGQHYKEPHNNIDNNDTTRIPAATISTSQPQENTFTTRNEHMLSISCEEEQPLDTESARLTQARRYLYQGWEHGYCHGRIDEALIAFDDAAQALLSLNSSLNSTSAPRHALLSRLYLCQAELQLLLFCNKAVELACQAALEQHELLCQALLHSTNSNHHKEDPELSMLLDVFQADVLRCKSIAHFRGSSSEHETCDARAKALLQPHVPHSARATSLLALFGSYAITINAESTDARADCERAIDVLGQLYEESPEITATSSQEKYPSVNHILWALQGPQPLAELHSRRLAVVLRLGSYALREEERQDETLRAVRGAVQVAERSCRARPRAPAYWLELYHCHCATAEHLEWSDYDLQSISVARKQAAAALERLTSLMPMVPKYWRSLCGAYIDVADLQDRLGGADLLALQTATQALDAATRCLACFKDANHDCGEISFEDRVEYARALLERGRHGYIQNMHEDALSYYERALDTYCQDILTHERGQREDEFYQELVLRSLQTASNCAMAGTNLEDRAMSLLQRAKPMRTDVKLRKNKVSSAICIVELADLLLKNQRPVDACELLEEFVHDFLKPLFDQVSWHTTLRSLLTRSFLILAKSRCARHHALLETKFWRSYLAMEGERHGKDYSEWTDQEHEKYQYILNYDELERLRQVCEQVPPVKKYRLPLRNTTTNQTSWYSFEIGSAIPGIADPLIDQARVWKEDFDVEMSAEVRDSFCKLHELALRNNVSFTELCDYALNSNSNSSSDNDDATAPTAAESDSSDNESNEEQHENDHLLSADELDSSIPLLIQVVNEPPEDQT